MNTFDVADLDDLALGAVFLATGGGGDPYIAALAARAALERAGPAKVVAADTLDDDAFVVALGSVGAPSAGLELLPSIEEPAEALRAYERHVGRRVDAVAGFEIGGANSLAPIVAAAITGVPVVDGDGMGRAFPEAQMMTYAIAGVSPTPAIALDYAGNVVSLAGQDAMTYERHIRALSQAMGGLVTTVEHPMSGAQLKASVVPGTISFATALGRVLHAHRGQAQDVMAPLKALFSKSMYGELSLLYTGKVSDMASTTEQGFDRGVLTIEAFDGAAEPMRIDIKNEFIAATVGTRVVASVPDLIVVLDLETSVPVNAERVRFGQRLAVLAIGCPDFYRTERALEVVAPRCFGLDFDYVPVEQLGGGAS